MKEKEKNEKARGEMREIGRGCQSMSMIGIYKLLFSDYIIVAYLRKKNFVQNSYYPHISI